MYMNACRCAALVICGFSLLAGCSSGSHGSSGARPLVAAINAVADMPQVTFLREEEVWSSLDYGQATDFKSVDADQYNVNFDALLPGDKTTSCQGDVNRNGTKDEDECTRLNTTSINVLNDHEYVVALLGSYGNLHVRVYDKAAHTFDTSVDDGNGEDTNMEVQFFHWSDSLGPVDVYLEPPGTNLSAVQVEATLQEGDEFDGLVDEGTYVLSLTAVGDPSQAVYTSEAFTLAKQTRVAFAILDGTADGTSAIRVSRFRDQGGDLLDRRIDTQMRVAHVAPSTGNVDIYAQEDYTQPFVGDLAFKQTSAYTSVPSAALASLELDVTPAANPGVLLTRTQTSLSKGTRSTFFLVESATGNLDAIKVQDQLRRIAPYAKLRIVNSTGASLDFYVIPHGNNVFTSTPTETLSTGSSGTVHLLDPGPYDVVMADAGTDTYVFGPLNVDLAGDGIYTIVAVATADATTEDAVLLDDFAK